MLTVCSYHLTYSFQSESTLYSWLKSIVECTEEWYSSVYNEDYMRTVENSKFFLSDEDDSLLFDSAIF